MRISDIKPYERNARRNEKAIPIVDEIIKECGLRGQIILESRENPVIVCGHTRVEACSVQNDLQAVPGAAFPLGRCRGKAFQAPAGG